MHHPGDGTTIQNHVLFLVLHIMTFEMRPLITTYSHTALGFSNSLIVTARFTQWQGKSCFHTKPGMFKILTQREGTNIINLPTCQQLETPLGGPRLLWQLPWAVFRTHMTCCYWINQVTVFQGQFSILRNKPSYLKWPLFLLLYLLKSQLLGRIPNIEH